MTAASGVAGHWQGDDLLLAVHAQPGAKCTGFAGLHGEALKIRVQAPPLDGRANKELCRFLADAFGVPQSQVELLGGEGARQKRFRIQKVRQVPADIATLFPPKP